MCACVFTLPVYACVCVHVCMWAYRCTSVCVRARALGVVPAQKWRRSCDCPKCRLVAILPLTSRWRECSGKVKAAGAVLRAGESILCCSGWWAEWPTLQADVQGQRFWLAAFPERRSRPVSTIPLTFPISQRPSVQVYISQVLGLASKKGRQSSAIAQMQGSWELDWDSLPWCWTLL